ncbi:MAG: molybdenum cofactor biosynthesis protein MoaE [Coriobacteriia bacterium]|jgi:molybdopterin synthase catalytic subunit|nr:molybdenum cofactor biosynthesis protein MoaE [Coriobacteriia bacterium]
MNASSAPDLNAWVDEVKSSEHAAEVGMILMHRGIVRGHSRAGEPVGGMTLSVDRSRLAEVISEAEQWPGILIIRCWVNEGRLAVGDDIMAVLVAGDIRDNVLGALERLVSVIKTEVVSETELA